MDLNYWINLKDYTVPQLTWNGIGCFLWLITYAALIREIVKLKFVEMPFLIAAGNIAWEFVWSFNFHPTTGKLYALAYQGCFVLDIFIFFWVFKYGTKAVDIPQLKKYFRWILCGLFFLWLPLNYFYVAQGYDTPIGANSGYILNLIISLLYPIVLWRNNPQNFSPIVAWAKYLGTGCITVSMFLIYPTNYFVQILGAACFVLDLAFAIVLTRIYLKNKWSVFFR